MAKIKSIQAREILDSRANPTIETEITLENGLKAKASVPSGVSTGVHEALELRDNNPKRYDGKGVFKACENVNKKINQALKGMEVFEQQAIDQKMIELDGTKNKSKLGANAILSVSLACCRAGALALDLPLYKYLSQLVVPEDSSREITLSSLRTPRNERGNYKLPRPMFNIFNGGKHGDTNLDFQEFMVVPSKQINTNSSADKYRSFKKMLEIGVEIFHSLGDVLRSHGLDTDLGNEGGYAPNILSSEEAIELILEAVKKARYQYGKDVFLAIDAGASTLYNKRTKKYILKADKLSLNQDQMIEFYLDWLKKYPFISIEDPLYEDDWTGWQKLNCKSQIPNSKFLIVGDDLFTTNIERLEKGIELEAANAVIIKPNQIGTLTETINCVKLAKRAGFKIICSHRSGETNDTFIADLAVACQADFIKAGAPSRGERVAKYNRLMEIEEGLKLY
jgi:enolase